MICSMIISFRHNFIYFRPKKTGGTTIMEMLRPNLGEGDFPVERMFQTILRFTAGRIWRLRK